MGFLSGGNQAIGAGQAWQDVTASRAAGTIYYNTSGKPIMVNINVQLSSTEAGVFVDGLMSSQAAGTGNGGTHTVIVQAGSSYQLTAGVTINLWTELR